MADKLVTLLRNPGDRTFYSTGFINTIEDHLAFLQDIGNGKSYSPTGMELYRYQGRFYAFLRDVIGLKLPEYYYAYLRANNMTSPDQFDSRYSALILPDTTKIDQIMKLYVSSLPNN